MHLASGRAFTIATISCPLVLIIALFILACPGVVSAQDKNPQQPVSEPASQPTPPKVDSPVAGQQKSPNEIDGPVIVNTDLITFTVTVTDTYGRYVSGLAKNAFTVLDEKKAQEITFFSDDDAPVSVGVIFDVSGSMSGDKVRRARDALSKFIQTSHNSDEYFLIAFNQRAQLFSRYTFSELRRLLKESDVVLYGIGILSGSDAGSQMGMEGQGILDELASVSGGKAFFPRSNAEMDDIFEQIALELRHQYSIGYKPVNFTSNGRWHKIKVKVTPPRGLPRLFVRSKEGYYALPGSR